MSGERLYLFDTTLRDGAQTQGVDFSVADKLAIAEELDHHCVGRECGFVLTTQARGLMHLETESVTE